MDQGANRPVNGEVTDSASDDSISDEDNLGARSNVDERVIVAQPDDSHALSVASNS